MSINFADVAVVLILILCVQSSMRRGITYFLRDIIRRLVSLFASVSLYGLVSSALRESTVFEFIRGGIREKLDFGALLDGALSRPDEAHDSIWNQILANDNNVIYKIFNVETFEEYAASYVTNITINIIAIVLIYFCVSFIIKAIFSMHRGFVRLPGIKHINRLTGMIGGLIQGTIIIWILMLGLTFFAVQGTATGVYETIFTSKLAIYFYEYNIFIKAIFKVAA